MSTSGGIKKKSVVKPKPRPSGISLLDGIMGNVSRLHSSLPARPRGAAAVEEEEVASPYLIPGGSMAGTASSSAASPGVRVKEVCRNTQCGRSDFETDMRGGDRICTHCGVVQNSRSLESQEEEHRTFADDDKAQDKKRAEVSRDGRTGGIVADRALAKVSSIAASSAEQDGDLTEKDFKRLDKYRVATRDLADVMSLSLSAQVVQDALDACDRYVRSTVAHAKLCKIGSKRCRLSSSGQAKGQVEHVAAAAMRIGLQASNFDRQLQELADFLKRMPGGVSDATTSSVFKAYQLVNDHLKAYNNEQRYECSDNAPAQAIVNEAPQNVDAAVTQYTSLLPRIGRAMRPEPPFMIQNRAADLIKGWHGQGLPSLTTRTIAASAMHMAFEDLRHQLTEGAFHYELDADALCAAAEIEPNTLRSAMGELKKMGAVPNAYLE